MERFFNSIPKPALIVGALILGIPLGIIFYGTPHSMCDTQKDVFIEKQHGSLFSVKAGKSTVPPVIIAAKASCQSRATAGACLEYFDILKKLSNDLLGSDQVCMADLADIDQVRIALKDGLEIMVRLAWGFEIPKDDGSKVSWFQESDLVIYCKINRVLRSSLSEEDFQSLQKRIIKKLPAERGTFTSDPVGAAAGGSSAGSGSPSPSGGESPALPKDAGTEAVEPIAPFGLNSTFTPALEKLSESEIIKRSLMSTNCEVY